MIKRSNNPKDYYEFNDVQKEVTFKRYDTPTPWMNYLSNDDFHTMISQAGGGVSFYKSPQIWRINRYKFFNIPTDRSGHYVYIQDEATGEYFSPTAEPVETKPDEWKSSHGLGYTRFSAKRKNIESSITYFVGKEDALIWNLKVKNSGDTEIKLKIFAYVELGIMEPIREMQWQCYMKHMLSVEYKNGISALIYKYFDGNRPKQDETPLVYLAADRTPSAYDGDRDEFIDSYRSESNPYALENGGCSNSTLFGGDPCAALQFNITLQPNEEQTINIYLGTGKSELEIEKSLVRLREKGAVENEFKQLNKYWEEYLNKFRCKVGDEDIERQINIWNPYQAYRNFQFSRNISFYATGTVRGVGFRDTAQDVLARIPFDIKSSKQQIKDLLEQQYSDGHANHYYFPVEGYDPVTSIHSDDHLWLILSVWSLVMEVGDISFLDEEVKYYDGGTETIYEHLLKAIDYSKKNMGANGFPLMLRSDWNDVLNKVCKEGKGESIWTGMQFSLMLLKMSELARLKNLVEDEKEFTRLYEEQKAVINEKAWDGKWYMRAVMDNGVFLGTEEQEEAKIWLNPQSWATMSGIADKNRALKAMDSVADILDTPLGIKKIHPPIVNFPNPKDPLTQYNPGTGENGSVFCHANTWAIMAECINGRGNIAHKYYRQLIPNIAMDKAGIRRYKAEPYVYSSNLFGPDSDKFGLANVSWLSGTAAWMYIAATQYILGVRPCWTGLKIDPCINENWDNVKIIREFRGCKYNIVINNPNKVCKGVVAVIVDGDKIEGNIITQNKGRTECNVIVTMG